MFRLREFESRDEKQKAAEMLKDELLKMKSGISVIREFEVGINVTDNPSAYDLVINSAFDTPEDLEAYRVHPDHQAFIGFNARFSIAKAIVDYIF